MRAVNTKNKIAAIESERSILGAILIDPSCLDSVSSIPLEEHFYIKQHQLIFSHLTACSFQNIDIVNISDALDSRITLDYLVDLAKNACSKSTLDSHINLIKKKYKIRSFLSALNEIYDKINEGDLDDISNIVNYTESKIINFSAQDVAKEDKLSDICKEFAEQITSESKNNVRTGFQQLDDITYGGFKQEQFVILAARPGMGKTAFALNIASNIVSKKDAHPVLLFNLEMSKVDLVKRIVSSQGQIDQKHLFNPDPKSEYWIKILETVGLVGDQNIFIHSSPYVDCALIRSRSRGLVRKYDGLSLIIVDYLQLITVPNLEYQPTLSTSCISKQLKLLARELKVPILALCQLNRNPDERLDKRPILSDLRDSGSLEQDADLVAFIYREELYSRHDADAGKAELIIAKQRNGPTGTIKMHFNGKYCSFFDL